VYVNCPPSKLSCRPSYPNACRMLRDRDVYTLTQGLPQVYHKHRMKAKGLGQVAGIYLVNEKTAMRPQNLGCEFVIVWVILMKRVSFNALGRR